MAGSKAAPKKEQSEGSHFKEFVAAAKEQGVNLPDADDEVVSVSSATDSEVRTYTPPHEPLFCLASQGQDHSIASSYMVTLLYVLAVAGA